MFLRFARASLRLQYSIVVFFSHEENAIHSWLSSWHENICAEDDWCQQFADNFNENILWYQLRLMLSLLQKPEEENKVEHDLKYVDTFPNIDHSWKHLSFDQVSKLVGVFLFNLGVEGNLPYLSILIDHSNLGHARQAILGNRTSNPYNPCFMVPCRNTERVIARGESPYRL